MSVSKMKESIEKTAKDNNTKRLLTADKTLKLNMV